MREEALFHAYRMVRRALHRRIYEPEDAEDPPISEEEARRLAELEAVQRAIVEEAIATGQMERPGLPQKEISDDTATTGDTQREGDHREG